jgi:hypothetical protein
LVLLALAAGVPLEEEELVRRMYRGEPDYERRWPVEFHIRVVEPLTQRFARGLRELGAGLERGYFVECARVELGAEGAPGPLIDDITRSEWRPASSTLDAYLASFAYVDRAELKVKSGRIVGEGRFDAVAKLEVAGRERSGSLRHDRGVADVGFTRTAEGWRIVRLVVTSMTTDRAPDYAYRDATDRFLSKLDPSVRARIDRLSASDHIHRRMLAGDRIDPRLVPVAMDAHPGVSVVDLDRDGFDDLFVWDLLGPSLFLRNDRGALLDETDAYGLRFDNTNGAHFADLDGDGILDMVLASWFSRSALFFGAEDGRWRPEPSSVDLPAEVATVAFADVNGDGLLDVFLGTAAHDHHAKVAGEGADANVDQIGPRNRLLLNLGGRRFADRTEAMGLGLERNTLAAAFADYDDDGRVDLFLGNDFAPANLFRNDGTRFADVSRETGADRIFFGMGASWGDVDGDGDLDLYASSMASSAGRRIMSEARHFAPILGLDDQRRRIDAARGNTLLVNEGGRFADGTESRYAQGRSAGWAYGAQLFDANGDGWLDVYSPNGFFTAEGASEGVFRDL